MTPFVILLLGGLAVWVCAFRAMRLDEYRLGMWLNVIGAALIWCGLVGGALRIAVP